MKKKIEIACPKCGKQFNYYSSESRPFCTKKCKMIDLGHWFEESYNIKGRDYSVYIEEPDSLKDMMDETY